MRTDSVVNLFEFADNLWDSLWGSTSEPKYTVYQPYNPVSALGRELVSSNFPPSNISTDKEKNLAIEVALAGYNKDEVDLTYDPENKQLVLGLKPKEEIDPEKLYIQKAIKRKEHEVRYSVDLTSFHVDKIETKLKDGLLTIKLLRKDAEKPLKLKID